MKKFLFIRHGYFPSDPRVKKQVRALIEIGHSVDVICLGKKGEKFNEIVENAKVLRLPLQHRRASLLWYFIEYTIGFLLFFLVISIRSLYKKYDYIIVHTLPDYLTFTTILPKLLGVKIVTDFHEPTAELIMTKYNIGKGHLFVKAALILEQLVIKYSAFSITVTKALRQRYISSGANPDKVFVTSNAIDESDFKFESASITRNKSDKFRIITHGSIEERYGHEVVIRAVNALKDRFPGLTFIIAGDGSHSEELKELVRTLGCEENVEFLGYLPFNKLLENLVNSDIGIISMYKTPYSVLIDTNKMYEYFDLGLPVILPKLAPLQENFNESEVIFFEPGDYQDLSFKLEDVMQTRINLADLSSNANLKYDKLKWNIVKHSFTNLFIN